MPPAPPPIVLITRPAAQAAEAAAALRAARPGLRVVTAPLMEIVARPLAVAPEGYAGLIFTSVNGVAAFAAASGLRDRPVWCVGDATAAAARETGFAAPVTAGPAGGDAESLLRLLLGARPDGPLLHLRGAHARGDLAPRLTAAGLPCDATVIYDQTEIPVGPEGRDVLTGRTPVVLPLYSPRSARLAARAILHVSATAPLHPVAISPAAAEAWAATRTEVPRICTRPDGAAMLQAVLATCDAIVA